MRFRPCIDLHQGKVKQIVGSTLRDAQGRTVVKENFVSDRPPSYYAKLYKRDGLIGGHVIMLGPGNEDAALDAIRAWPGGLQVGGGITADNARFWIEHGAQAVIVTSFCFSGGRFHEERARALVKSVGRERIVLDLSCRRGEGGDFFVVTDRWQRFTRFKVDREGLGVLSKWCFEFLVHGVDVEGQCQGIEEELVELLGRHSPIPTTYAGGIRSMEDIEKIGRLGKKRLDFTVGSALDIFGGAYLSYRELVSRFAS